MATAKLWWNGSSWATSVANAYSATLGSSYCRVAPRVRIIAYDNLTVKLEMYANCWSTSGGSAGFWGSFSCTRDGTSIINTSWEESNLVASKTVSATTTADATFSWRFRVNARNTSSNYMGWQTGTGSTTPTSPTVTITYDANGGTGNVGTQTVLRGIAATITPAVVPTRAYYQFTGWNTAADGTGTAYANGANITVSSDTTLYAQWSQTALAVSISADEGATITLDGQAFTNQTATIYKAAGTYAVTITANSGYIIKTRSPASDGNITISDNSTVLSATSQHTGLHLDNGESWDQYMVYIDNGTSWDLYLAYVDDGTTWAQVY